LTEAVNASCNWRGVMRELSLNEMSAGAIRIVRRHAVHLDLDTSHFRGKRRWSDTQLKNAMAGSSTWDEVLAALGLTPDSGSTRTHIKGRAIRLGLNFNHLEADAAIVSEPHTLTPDLKHLREAGGSIAAAWFTMCGCSVLFPIEPTTYDIVVSTPEGLRRVQVKTTTHYSRNGWMVAVGRRPYSAGNTAPLVSYDPDVIDYFLIIDGDLNLYLIPSRLIAGRVGILLRTYTDYIVGNASGLLAVSSGARDSGERLAGT
jgi:PD-(D/E)XK endonuclease